MAWSNSYAVTIDHTKVSTATQTNFPLLFTGVYPALATVANGGSVTNANGFDIIFASDSLGASPIPFERAAWAGINGACEFWVQIASLSNTVDTTIYILFGNSAIITDQQTLSTVWSAYQAVYHLASAAILSVADSSGNGNGGIAGNNGTAMPTLAKSGVGAGSAVFATSGIYIPSFSFATFSLSCWIYATASGGNYSMLGGAVAANCVEFQHRGSQICLVKQNVAVLLAGSTITTNTWQHVAASYNSSTGAIALYLNGASAGTGTSLTTFVASNYYLGFSHTTENFAGNLDEFRISNSIVSAGWIATEYNNQNSPWTFYSTSLTRNAGPFNPGAWGPFPTAPAYMAAVPSYYVVTPVAAALQGGTTGVAYSETITAQGGTSPYTFAVTSGSLPTGTSMSAGGVISGTPTVASTYSFTVTATDAASNTGSTPFTIVVASAPPAGGGSFVFIS